MREYVCVCVCVRFTSFIIPSRGGRVRALSSECKIVSQFFIQGEGEVKVT